MSYLKNIEHSIRNFISRQDQLSLTERSLLIAVFSGLLAGILMLTPPKLVSAIIVGILFSVAIYFLSYFSVTEDRRETQIKNIADSITLQEKRMENILEYFALSDSRGYFNETLLNMRNLNGTVKWLVAKFISEKLAYDIPQPGVITLHKIPLRLFADISGELVKECENTVCWTCPYTPTNWFSSMFYHEKEKLDKLLAGSLSIEDIHRDLDYLRTFLGLNLGGNKKRLINLSSENYQKMLSDPLLGLFIKVNSHPSFDLKFANVSDQEFRETEKIEADFSVYDSQVVVEWIPEDGLSHEGTVSLSIGPPKDPYCELFDDKHWNRYRSIDDIAKDSSLLN